MILYFKGTAYNLPHQKGYTMNRTIDSSFDSATVTLILRDEYGDLDVTRRLPRDLIVEIDGFRFRTGETNVDKINENGDYKHIVSLVSMSRIFTRMPLENIAVTQPQGDLGTYNRSVNVLSEELEIFSTGGINETNYDTASYDNVIETNDTVIDDMDIISVEEYTISLQSKINAISQYGGFDVYVNVKYDGATIYSASEIMPSNGGSPLAYATIQPAYTFKYTPTASGTLSVEYGFTCSNGETLVIDESVVTITAVETVAKPIRTYAQLVDKILRHQRYVLNAYSRERLNRTAPEDKFENYTIADALVKIGSYNGALLRVYDEIYERYWKTTTAGVYDIEGDSVYDFSPYEYDLDVVLKVGTKYYVNAELDTLVREIGYEWFDNPNVIDMDYTAKQERAELEDYVAGIQQSAPNIIKQVRYSPMKGAFKGVRTTDIGQQTTSNLIYECEDDIERPIQVLVKGLASTNASGTITYSESDVTDITSRIVNEKYYNTLSDEKDVSYSGKLVLRKHNTLYFTQGDRFLKGLSYLGEDQSQIIGNPDVIRAWVETILAVRSENEGELMTRNGTQSQDDEGLDGDLKLLFQVKYQNITETHARVYKDDISGFENETIKYINESSNINDASAIGDYAQEIVNRLGGTKVILKGECDSYDDLPNLGDVDSEGRVYTVINTQKTNNVSYTLTLVQDYNKINALISINSRLRFEEVSSSDETMRMLRYTSRFIFTPTQETFSTRWISSEDMLDHLFNNPTQGLNYAYLEFNYANGDSSKIHASVDTYAQGRTLQVQIQMKDNYSAGLQRYSKDIGGETVYFNRDVSYTDYYGKANDMSVYIYYDNTLTDSDMIAYPEATTTKGDELATVITDYIDKDARERIGILGEVAFFSQDEEVIVFSGFAKYNKLVENSKTIATGLLKYIPPKNAKIVDLSLVRDMTVSGTYEFGKFDFSWNAATNGFGIVWYEQDTLELIMAYVSPITAGSGSATKYYKIEEEIWGGGFSIVTLLKKDLYVTSSFDISDATGIEITHNVNIDYEQIRGIIVEGLLNLEVTSSIDISDTIGNEINHIIDINYSSTAQTSKDLEIDMLVNSLFDISETTTYEVDGTINVMLTKNILKPIVPVINEVSTSNHTITFTLTNNNVDTGDIYYDIGVLPETDYVTVSGSSTSSNITISGLDRNTTYTLFARTLIYGRFSAFDDENFTTTNDNEWSVVLTTTFDDEISVYIDNPLDNSEILAAVEASRPAGGYAIGYQLKVNVYTNTLPITYIQTVYVEVI